MMKLKTDRIIALAILINIFLVLLPTYDTFNYSSWVQSILTIHNNLPAFYYNINPGGLFTAIFLVPMSLTYSFTTSFYITAVVTKAIILLFFLMSVYLFSKMMESYTDNRSSVNFATILYLLSPGILFVNFVWSEMDIISVFFVTLAIYFLRIRPIRMKNMNDIFFAVSIFISILSFLYPVILLPSFVYFTKGSRNKINLLVTLTIGGIIFAAMDLVLFQGHLYNYVSSLSGTSTTLTPGGLRTGLFYYFQFFGLQKESIEIVLVLFLAIVIPYILKQLNLDEFKVQFIILAVFLFISPVINRDNFLFVLPFLFLAALEPLGKTMSKGKITVMSLFLLLPLFSAVSGGVNNTYGIFYWFYPVLHESGPILFAKIQQTIIVPAYNLYFITILFVSITLLLIGNRKEIIVKFDRITQDGWNSKVPKLFVITIVLVILIIAPISVIYNNSNNNVSIKNPKEFPILYFYPENNLNSTFAVPVGSDSFSLHDNKLEIPSNLHNLILEDSLMNETYGISGNYQMSNTSSLPNLSFSQLIGGQRWSVSDVSMLYNKSFLPVSNKNHSSVLTEKNFIPYIGNQSAFNPLTANQMIYRLNYSNMSNNTYLVFFKQPINLTREQVPICLSSGQNLIYITSQYYQYTITDHVRNTSLYSNNSIPINEHTIAKWNYILINKKSDELSLTMDGTTQTDLFGNCKSVTISIGSMMNNSSSSFNGTETGLISSNTSKVSYVQRILVCDDSSWKSMGKINNEESLIFKIKTNYTTGNLSLNSKVFQLKDNSYFYVGKLGGNENITITINHLNVNYEGSSGYYLIPLFLAFSIPVSFGILSTLYIAFLESDLRMFKNGKGK